MDMSTNDERKLMAEAASTIESLIHFVEQTYTSEGESLPEDVAETLMKDWELIRRLNHTANAPKKYPGRIAEDERDLADD